MIDLHIHTNHSDGTDNVLGVLQKAEMLNLPYISITDHDSVKAYEELKNIDVKKYYTGTIIPGAEIKTTFNGIPVEVLGYDFDVEKFSKSECVNEKRKIDLQNKYLQNYIEVGNQLGLMCNPNLIVTSNKEWAALIYRAEIEKYPENYGIVPELLECKHTEFYRLTAGNPHSPFYLDETEDNLDINFVIDEIHRCGGKTFLAHLFAYKLEKPMEFLNLLFQTTNIDGCECYYSEFTEEETKMIVECALANAKLMSGGSDYHGTLKKIELGTGLGNLAVPNDIISWYQEIPEN